MNRMDVIAALVTALFVIGAGTSRGAEVSLAYEVNGNIYGFLSLKGEIVDGDFDKIMNYAKLRDTIVLDSPGGNVTEAMRIGRLLRKYHYRIFVEENAQCNSACFFIYVAGIQQYNLAPIGIHRPYFDKAYYSGLSAVEAQSNYAEMMTNVEPYMTEMGVPAELIDEMMNIRSTDLKMLSVDELAHRGFRPYPISFHEWIIAQCGDLSDEVWYDYSYAVLERTGTKKPRNISPGYNEYLLKTGDAITSCRDEMRLEAWKGATNKDSDKWRKCVRDRPSSDTFKKKKFEACSEEVASQY